MDGRPNGTNKAEFCNFSGVVFCSHWVFFVCSLEFLIKSLSLSVVLELWLGLFNRNRNTHLTGRK